MEAAILLEDGTLLLSPTKSIRPKKNGIKIQEFLGEHEFLLFILQFLLSFGPWSLI
jgi:hypothetical protein